MSQYTGPASKGFRAQGLMKEREKRQKEMEEEERRLELETERKVKVTNKFERTSANNVDEQVRIQTYGLVTLDQMKQVQKELEEDRARKVAAALPAADDKPKKTKKRAAKLVVSFDPEDDEAEADAVNSRPADHGEMSSKRGRLGMNPLVDTSFLPDRDREERERLRREELRKEWVAQQEATKHEKVEITYSYWDGSGNRRSIEMEKGQSIFQFLQGCLLDLRKEFPELRGVTAEQLMYIKEDLIIPTHYTFYDFIVTKARGKSGPLFNFDVHDDIRLVVDAGVEKDESHAGKVCLRSWYERNKHIFPASRWEAYDPTKDYGSYTIKDTLKQST